MFIAPGVSQFALVLAALLCVAPLRAEEQTLEEYAKESVSKEAYGVYFGKNKIGWFIEETKLVEHKGEQALQSTSVGAMRLQVLGAPLIMDMNEKQVYSLKGEGELLYAESTMKEGNEGKEDSFETTKIVAIAKDGKLHITTTTDKDERKREVKIPRDTLKHAMEVDAWVEGVQKKGSTVEVFTTDLNEDQVEQTMEMTFLERKKVTLNGVPTTVYKMKANVQGVQMVQTMTEEGSLIEGKMGPFDLRAEEVATVKKLDVVVLDGLSVIPVNKDVGNPKKIDVMTLELSGLEDFELPTDHRQRVIEKKDGVTIFELKREFLPEKTTELTDEEKQEHLKATTAYQVDAEEMQQLSKKIVGDETDPLKKADKLQRWVYRNLRKTYNSNASTSLRVLENKAGDCTEHSMLFVTLARAAGIPTREVSGLGYTDFGQPSFGWHAWAEIHTGTHWVAVDPTWNELMVDGTHLKVSHGSNDYSAVNIMGRLKVKIISVEKKRSFLDRLKGDGKKEEKKDAEPEKANE